MTGDDVLGFDVWVLTGHWPFRRVRRVRGHSLEDWKTLPPTGVVWASFYRPTGRTFYSGGDWYTWKDGGLEYVPSREWDRRWQPRPEGCQDCTKRGDAVPDRVFERVQKEAWSTWL